MAAVADGIEPAMLVCVPMAMFPILVAAMVAMLEAIPEPILDSMSMNGCHYGYLDEEKVFQPTKN